VAILDLTYRGSQHECCCMVVAWSRILGKSGGATPNAEGFFAILKLALNTW